MEKIVCVQTEACGFVIATRRASEIRKTENRLLGDKAVSCPLVVLIIVFDRIMGEGENWFAGFVTRDKSSIANWYYQLSFKISRLKFRLTAY